MAQAYPYYSFWVAPVTLVFENAWNVRMSGAIGQMDMAELFGLNRVRHFTNAAGVEFDEWHVEGDGFEIAVEASGFTQYFRQEPILTPSQRLTRAQRRGVSFDRVTLDGGEESEYPQDGS